MKFTFYLYNCDTGMKTGERKVVNAPTLAAAVEALLEECLRANKLACGSFQKSRPFVYLSGAPFGNGAGKTVWIPLDENGKVVGDGA